MRFLQRLPIRPRLLPSLALAVGLSACGPSSPPGGPPSGDSAGPPKQAEPLVYYVLGNVKELRPTEGRMIVEHEAIAGFMEAMTMPFNVGNQDEFSGIQTNDRIHFRLVVEDQRSWIDQITKVGEVMNLTNVTRKDFRLVRDVEPLEIGDALPDYPLTNHLGQAFHTGDFKGRVLVISLIFTRCPLPDFCPRMSLHLGRTRQLLKADPAVPANWHLLSVSFDPEFDTPSVLAAHARQLGADPADWTFATGALIEVDDLTERFGMYFARESGGVTFNHNLRTIVIDPAGRVHQVLIGNSWSPEDLVQAIKKAAVSTTAASIDPVSKGK